MPVNPSAKRIMDGTSWAEFCDKLKSAGNIILREGSPNDPFDRAEGFRYLSRLTRVALESYIEFADPAAPVLRRPAHATVKIGADNPDHYYQSAAISGKYQYRILGKRGTVHYLGLGTYVGHSGSGRRIDRGRFERGRQRDPSDQGQLPADESHSRCLPPLDNGAPIVYPAGAASVPSRPGFFALIATLEPDLES